MTTRKAKTNNERLRELMQKHGLTRADVSSILGLAVTKGGQTPAVTKWLSLPDDGDGRTTGNFRAMPDIQLELLEYKLGERKVERWKRKKA